MKAGIITIGDELLLGQVIDSNSAWMGQFLGDKGIKVVRKLTVSDSREDILYALKQVSDVADLVLMTGGLGPTRDDITKKVLADYLGVEMEFHTPTWERIEKLFARWGRSTTEEHRQQCFMPQGTHFIHNKMGTAPGMLYSHNDTTIISMPGVPYEMKYIMEHGVSDWLDMQDLGQSLIYRTIKTVGEGESRISAKIEDIIDDFPSWLSIAFLPSLGQVRLRLTALDPDGDRKNELDSYVDTISNRLGDLVFGYDDDTLEKVIGKICVEKGIIIGIAESCTGGDISSRIVSIPGSSSYFKGSIVAYSNDVKKSILQVNNHTLVHSGAVSAETVKEMLTGVITSLDVDAGIAISGIAGPGGGSEEKPVGTVWIAYGSKEKQFTYHLKAGKDRIRNITYSGTYALNLLRKFLIGL